MKEELVTMLEEELGHSIELAGQLGTSDGRKQEIENVIKLAESLNAIDQTRNKNEDDQARQILEQHRIQTANEVELQKSKRKVGDYLLEAFKTVAPTVLSLLAYNVFQKRILFFEENGRIISTAGRELHLPNIFKK